MQDSGLMSEADGEVDDTVSIPPPSACTRLLYNVSLSWNQGWNCCRPASWAWWSHIDEHVMLGALPLASRGHLQRLQQGEGVTAVLSLNMPFELGADGRGAAALCIERALTIEAQVEGCVVLDGMGQAEQRDEPIQ